MLDELDNRLMQTREQLRNKQKLEAMMRQAQQTAETARSRCSELKKVLASEQADVEKLEGLTLTGLFHSVLGTKQERLDKERQEFLAAQLKHEEAAATLDEAQQEVQRIRSELDALLDAGTRYKELINEKEKLLAQSGGQSAERLLVLSERLADLTSDRKELQEALRAGQAALSSLKTVSSELGSAANWGTLDMVGGGMISTMAKHSKIDSAKQHARQAQRRLQKFQQELADANQRLHVSLEIDGLTTFADYFLDGLIMDWVVQSKIQGASSACSKAISRVTAAVNECRKSLAKTEDELAKVSAERREFVEGA